jgi:hypothetical protein
MTPTADTSLADRAREARQALARHLSELRRIHLALAEDSRALKAFTAEGQALIEIELASEMLEQYLVANGAFLENMRGRFEARLTLLRRGEPSFTPTRAAAASVPASPAGHGAYWLAFSRLCAVLRRTARAAEA